MAQKNRQLAAKAERAARERAAFATDAAAKADRIAAIMSRPDTDALLAQVRRDLASGAVKAHRHAPTVIPRSAQRITPTDKVRASCHAIGRAFDARRRAGLANIGAQPVARQRIVIADPSGFWG